ncbi:hypothetical protein ABZ915_40335 [Streptomyces sp. NPDC046915]|uniref:hypothetical protein n=1 Tax=Streptomyces sp. NPDC046915 TaxID=3155257 RepID=UPI0033F51D6F
MHIQVIKGRLDLVLGDEKTEAFPGCWIHLPGKLPHTVRATEPTIMLLTMLPAPEPADSSGPAAARPAPTPVGRWRSRTTLARRRPATGRRMPRSRAAASTPVVPDEGRTAPPRRSGGLCPTGDGAVTVLE